MNGQIFREEDELFTETSWAAVMMGQGIAMQGHNPMAARIPYDKLRKELDEIERSVRFVVDGMLAHGKYLAHYCPASA
jgi:tryptophan halogenase